MWSWLLLAACRPVCGTTQVTTGGTGAAKFDVDGDGYADLTERCGTLAGAFGSRRVDYGLGQLILSGDSDAEGRIDFELSTYVLAVADVWFLLDHLQPGTTIGLESLAGSGIHLPTGEFVDLYTVFPLSGGTVTVLDRRPTRGTAAKVAVETADPEDIRLSWDLEFGGGAQHWQGEDWVQFDTDASGIGQPSAFPPDYVR